MPPPRPLPASRRDKGEGGEEGLPRSGILRITAPMRASASRRRAFAPGTVRPAASGALRREEAPRSVPRPADDTGLGAKKFAFQDSFPIFAFTKTGRGPAQPGRETPFPLVPAPAFRHLCTNEERMNVIDLIQGHKGTAFSFEVLPPLKGTGTERLFHTIDALREFNPAYINITNHRSEYVYKDLGGGIVQRVRIRRRPGTIAVAAAIQRHYGIHVVPHVLCSGYTREDTEYMLLDLQFLGISDLLVLRGDKAREDPAFRPTGDGYSHATELIGHINRFNEGFFVDGSPIKSPGTPFSYGVACYPEKHEEAPNPEADLAVLRQKAEMGASYAVTQLFYDNAKYFDFVARARRAGISIPIIPGIKPFARLPQFSVIPKTFHCDLPQALALEIRKCKTDEEARQVGIEWTVGQCRELIGRGVPSIHFYTVSAADSIREIARQIY